MSAERYADPEVTQALEATEAALREEQSALGALPLEHAALQARLEQLQTEREELHQELEALRRGRPKDHPRLPEVLEPPFEAWSQRPHPRRLLRNLLPALMVAGCALFLPWNQETLVLNGSLLLAALMMALFIFVSWRGRQWWRFGKTGIEMSGMKAPLRPLPYSQLVDIEAHVTPSQRKRGVGNVVVVQDGPAPMDLAVRRMTLKNVPEPERLAAWLLDRCTQPK